MTVGELILALQDYDPELPVRFGIDSAVRSPVGYVGTAEVDAWDRFGREHVVYIAPDADEVKL